MMIKREKYLTKIRPYYNKDIIKIITGIRRCGKTTLLNQIINELTNSGVKKDNIIFINFECLNNLKYTNITILVEYIKSFIKNNKQYYIFLDEIQNLLSWEEVIYELYKMYHSKLSIFITSSNNDLFSKEIKFKLKDEYIHFKLYPFTFKETCILLNIENNDDIKENFFDYITWGGMPQRYNQIEEISKKNYIIDIYNSIVMQDIVAVYKIKDIDLLNKIFNYLLSNTADFFSVVKLARYLENDNKKISLETIYNYLDFISKSSIFAKVERYDIKNNRILKGKYKYYLTDLGFTKIVDINKKDNLDFYLKNIVYNELVSKDYSINIGTLGNDEIDFIATKSKKKIYIQIAYTLNDDNIKNQKFNVYYKLKDNSSKYVLSMDNYNLSGNGIIHENIINFLLLNDL